MKAGAVIRIVLWSLIAVMLTGVMLSVMLLRGNIFSFGRGWFGTAYTYSEADKYTVGSGSVSQVIDSMEINWVDGSIEVESYDGDTVLISESGADNEDDMLRYRVKNGELIIQYRKSGRFPFDHYNLGKHLNIKVPAATAKNLDEIEVDSVSAGIDISDMTVSDKISIDSVSGAINLNRVSVSSLEVDTVSGNVKASGAIGGIDCDSVSGDVTVVTSIAPKEIDCDTVSGDTSVFIPENDGFEVSFDSAGGDFNCDFGVMKRGGRYVYGNGYAEYSVDSVSGDFTIGELSASGNAAAA